MTTNTPKDDKQTVEQERKHTRQILLKKIAEAKNPEEAEEWVGIYNQLHPPLEILGVIGLIVVLIIAGVFWLEYTIIENAEKSTLLSIPGLVEHTESITYDWTVQGGIGGLLVVTGGLIWIAHTMYKS